MIPVTADFNPSDLKTIPYEPGWCAYCGCACVTLATVRCCGDCARTCGECGGVRVHKENCKLVEAERPCATYCIYCHADVLTDAGYTAPMCARCSAVSDLIDRLNG